MSTLSELATSLVASEIVSLSNEINQKKAEGKKIYNYTIGDFSSQEFLIPELLQKEIIAAIEAGKTNYPPAAGLMALRESVAKFIKRYINIDYSPNEVLIAGGGRPLIFTTFQTIVNPGDKVIYATPSWNNNHYTFLHRGEHCALETMPENDFMPNPQDIQDNLDNAILLCLCTPQNPTGTTLGRDGLDEICRLVIEENKKRKANNLRCLYVLFDQMYFTLTYGNTQHLHPVALYPEMKEYTISLDGISKSFAATGLRTGWALAPKEIIQKMTGFLSHIGAWAPTPVQYATAAFLNNEDAVASYLEEMKAKIEERLNFISDRMMAMKQKGFNVDCIKPQAAIYLTIKFDLKGKTFNNNKLNTQSDVTKFLLEETGLAIVPFHCFGTDKESPWYRISVGASNLNDLNEVFNIVDEKLSELV